MAKLTEVDIAQSVIDKKKKKQQILKKMYWVKIISALVYGVIVGILGLKGQFVLAGYGAITLCSGYFGLKVLFPEIDPEQYGGIFAFVSDGFMPALALFVSTWIIFYTIIHNPVH
mmetsp:Transcript_7941/g.11781  ORF Transcript_7941/g.11781 Transcript_7941/m.11781 type:complete len:115 (-) Transcript_7941:51-395(-)